ncbi:MAG: hypothetical protein ABI426_08170, partial [Flavobacterium sp.]
IEIMDVIKDSNQIYTSFAIWKTKRNIPRFVNLVDYDNTLLLDLDKEICIKMFLETVKKTPKIVLEEFLFAENSIVKNQKEEHFSNQFIVSFYKETSI